MDPFLGEIRLVAFNFAPVGWAFCNGQTLSIAQNSALYALLGTVYGGDGTTTFALPNLQSRVVVGTGHSAGLSPYTIGQTAGAESTTLSVNNLPSHAHGFALSASNAAGNTSDPTNAFPGVASDSNGGASPIYTQTKGTAAMAAQVTQAVGGNAPVPTLQPCLALNYIIALQGIFPSRP